MHRCRCSRYSRASEITTFLRLIRLFLIRLVELCLKLKHGLEEVIMRYDEMIMDDIDWTIE